MSLLIFCALATLAFAAPPLVQDLEDSCVDGVNNVVTLDDIGTASAKVHVDNGVVQLYDKDGNPSCEEGKPKVAMPGLVRLVKGKVIVEKGIDIKESGVARWTLRKSFPFFAIPMCDDGKLATDQIPEKLCRQDAYPLIGDDFAKMFATPGEYDLEVILETANVSAEIETPKLSSMVSELVQGKWQAELRFESENETIAHIKAPSEDGWLTIG